MEGPFLLEASRRRSIYIVRSRDLQRGVVLIVFSETTRSRNLHKRLILIVLLEASGRQSIYIVRSRDLHRGVILIVLMETGRRQSICSAVRVFLYGFGFAIASAKQ